MSNEMYIDHYRLRPRDLFVVVAALTVIVAVGPALPAVRFFSDGADYLPFHTGLEFLSMSVSAMVFALGWSLRRQDRNSHAVLLAATFFAVALLDFAHTLSFAGMPDFVGPSGTEKAINFWLAGRIVAAAGLLAVAVVPVRTWSPAVCYAALLAAVAICGGSYWVGLWHSEWLPRTFSADQGLTGFKIAVEYVLSFAYFIAAAVLGWRAAQRNQSDLYWLSAAAWVLGLAELFFTLYAHVTDIFNLLGHLYKAVAYFMLYRGLFASRVVAPYELLAKERAHDPLTGLPNRVLMLSRLDNAILHAKRQGRRGAFLFLDLDQFKTVNDSLGHAAGDELLRHAANRLRRRVRDNDLLARMGGDEFVLLLERLPGGETAADFAQSMIDELKEPFVLACGQEVYIGGSVGICIYPDDADSSDQVIRNADAALYQAKSDGRGVFRFYTKALTDAANRRLDMVARLRRGLKRQEFTLHYQPLVTLPGCHIVGVEALVRWRPAGGELIPAHRFIPVAEETGLVVPLGDWVVHEACRQMKAWLDAGEPLETISVNLSPQQFRRPNIQEIISHALDATGLPARYLELEITEGSLMEAGPDVESRLKALKALGVRLAIDDFGTGYSSLAYLKRFPLDKLKVDRSFVKDIPDNQASTEIAAAIIGLGRILNLEVLAEGVETRAQLDQLRHLGCDTVQGYLFSEPVAAPDLVDLIHGSVTSLKMLARL